MVPHTGVGSSVRTRGAPNRALVHVDNFVQVFQPGHPAVPAGNLACTVEFVRQHGVQNGVHQGGFSGTGNSGDCGQYAKWEGNIDPQKVVLFGIDNGHHTVWIDRASLGR